MKEFASAEKLFIVTLLVLLITCHIFESGRTLASKHTHFTHQDNQSAGNVRMLTHGAVVQQRIRPGATDEYQIAISAQQFTQIVVMQKGVDLSVKVKALDASFSQESDNPNGSYGPETVSILPNVSGAYRIKVSAENKSLPAGDYELRVIGSRGDSRSDELRVTAERTFAEAQQLRRNAAKLQRPAADAEYTAAIKKYYDALEIWQNAGDPIGQGYSLTNAGRAYKALAKSELALADLTKSALLLHDAGDISGEAFALNEAGSVHRDFLFISDALPLYDNALKLRLSLGDRYGLAQLYNNIGLIYANIGHQPQAVENLDKALQLWRDLSIPSLEMNTLVTAAKARAEMGDLEIALSQYKTVLNYCDRELSNDKSLLKSSATYLKPFALNGLGLVYDTWAYADEARVNYQEALELFRANKLPREEADVFDNLGLLHAFLGEATLALDYFQRALVLREQVNQPKGWGVTLSNLGFAYTLLGQNGEALKRLTLALSLSERSGDRRFESYTLMRLGMVHVALRRPRNALAYYERALAIQQEPSFADLRGQAITLDMIGEALKLSGDEPLALKKHEEALELWKVIKDGHGQALSLYGIAQIERDRLNLGNARDRAEEAIHIVEKLRNRVSGRQLQMTYFAGKHDLYALAIDVRIKLYEANNSRANLETALSISEQARARNLLDLLSEAHVNPYKGMSRSNSDKYARLQRQIDQQTQTFLRYISMRDQQTAAVIEKKVTETIREQEQLLLSARTAGSGSSVRISPARPLAAREIQRLLDDNTMLLQFSLDEKRSHLWAVTSTKIDYHSLPSQADIEKPAYQLRRNIIAQEPQRVGEMRKHYLDRLRAEPPEQYRKSARELSRLILSAVAPELGTKRLVIVADGELQYIPFEILPLPESTVSAPLTSETSERQPLLVNNEIVYQPSASALALLRGVRRPKVSNAVAVIADPVFNNDGNSRLIRRSRGVEVSQSALARDMLARSLRDVGDTGGDFTLYRLEHSRKEADAIASVAPRGSLKAVGFEANRALVTGPRLKQFRIVHFATHGILNDKNPELSGLVLSMVNKRGQPEDGYLTLRDIYNLDLPVPLVVASACQTGIGKHVRGEGLIALTRGFMNAGAQTIVVSLWRVEDEATADLMKRFYNYMLGQEKLAPAAALRKAKMEMSQLHTPYYWAGFVLQGDWK